MNHLPECTATEVARRIDKRSREDPYTWEMALGEADEFSLPTRYIRRYGGTITLSQYRRPVRFEFPDKSLLWMHWETAGVTPPGSPQGIPLDSNIPEYSAPCRMTQQELSHWLADHLDWKKHQQEREAGVPGGFVWYHSNREKREMLDISENRPQSRLRWFTDYNSHSQEYLYGFTLSNSHKNPHRTEETVIIGTIPTQQEARRAVERIIKNSWAFGEESLQKLTFT